MLIGVLIGICLCIFVTVLYIAFKKDIEHTTRTIVEKLAPKEKGYIIEPPSHFDDEREEIINKNNQIGRDTPISELYENNS